MTTPPGLLAYIDPGTMQNMFGVLGPLLAGLAAVLGLLAWPFRFLYHQLKNKYRTFSPAGKLVVWLFVLGLLGGGGAAVYGFFFTGGEQPVTSQTAQGAAFERVIVLGIDGLDPGIVEQMMSAGQLPNFSKLAAIGAYSRLATTNPPESPVAWSTIATGSGPGEHGIFDFMHREPARYLPYLSLRKPKTGFFGTTYDKPRRRDGFWVYTSATRIPTSIIRWPVAFPAEEVTGRFLSGFGVPDLIGGEGRYAYYTSAPLAKDDPARQNAVEIVWNGTSVKTRIEGPATAPKKYSTLDMTVTRAADDAVTIAVEGANPIKAVKDEWSSWVPLHFSVGLGKKVHGIAKFMVTQIQPHLQFVCSPIHMDPARQAFAFTWPGDFGAELEERLGPFHTLGMPEQVHPLSHERYGYEAFLAECRSVMTERRKMLEIELARFDRGLLAFVFDTSDRVQHAFWATRDPDHPAYNPEDAAKYAHVIPDVYREADEILAGVLAKLDDKTALIVLSDHGFNSFRRSVHVNRWLIDNGYMSLVAVDQSQAPDPTSPPAGRELFRDVDWSRTKAYALGFASIYLNAKGREGKGIVDSARESRPLCEEIAAKLRGWKDPQTGQPICHNVYIAADLYRGQAAPDGPDLIVGLNPGYRFSWQTAIGGAPAALVEDNKKRWSGDHLIDPYFVPGILFTNQQLQASAPSVLDVCPTVLKCFGIPRPAHMTGKPLF